MTLRAAGLALTALAVAASVSQAAPQRPLTAQADVRLLAARMESLHPNLFHAVSRNEFRQAVETLASRADGLGRDALLVELMRLAALPGERDGHTGIFPLDSHRSPLHFFPIRLYDFPEGLFVVAEVGRRGLVGSRLVSIEGVPTDDVAAKVRPLVPADNESSRRARLSHYLLVSEVLHGLGVAGRSGPLRFTFRRPGGALVDVSLVSIPADRYARAFPDLFHPMVPIGLPRREKPPYLARRTQSWWAATIDRGRAVYAAYNITTIPTGPLARQLLRLASRPRIRRVIVDLRHNPGGNNTTYGELLRALGSRRIDRPGRLVVLIGRTTFSAAANFATEVDRLTRARFVGEPTGGSPNHYGDPVGITLPATGWKANVAAVYSEKGGASDRRLAVEPDVSVELTAASFFAGRDPVLARSRAIR